MESPDDSKSDVEIQSTPDISNTDISKYPLI